MLSEQQKDDFKWYKGEMVDLFNELGHCFAVIRHREVVATFPTFDEAADYAIDTYEPRTFIVQEIGPDPSAYTMQISSSWVVAGAKAGLTLILHSQSLIAQPVRIAQDHFSGQGTR